MRIDAFINKLAILMEEARGLPPDEVLAALEENAEVCRGEVLRRRYRQLEESGGVEPFRETDGA